ncbi:MAG TPA: NADH-quinone oxidoreductase subunit N, partial [Burkholderiales bacterium]
MEYITPLAPAVPELFLLGMACAILIADLFVTDARRVISYALTQAALLGCFIITYLTATLEPVTTFSDMFVDDIMGDVLKLLVYVAAMVMLVYSRPYLAARGMFRGEFFVLVLFATLGMMVMISANHLLTLYLGLELLTLSLYAMVALQRDSAVATEAAMKYFVLGALASGLLLYGMSMLYGATGTLEIEKVAEAIAKWRASGGGAAPEEWEAKRAMLVFGLVFIVAGVAFKLGVVPFHMWIPDVYDGAPNAMTLFIGTAPELAAFAMAMRLLVNGLLDLA